MDDLYDQAVREHMRHNFRAPIGVRPGCLIGLVWLAAARSLRTDRPPQVCERCQGVFLPNPSCRNRRDRYCGNPCRQASHREKKKRAEKLLVQGVAAADVAARVGVKPATSEKWAAEIESDRDEKEEIKCRARSAFMAVIADSEKSFADSNVGDSISRILGSSAPLSLSFSSMRVPEREYQFADNRRAVEHHSRLKRLHPQPGCPPSIHAEPVPSRAAGATTVLYGTTHRQRG